MFIFVLSLQSFIYIEQQTRIPTCGTDNTSETTSTYIYSRLLVQIRVYKLKSYRFLNVLIKSSISETNVSGCFKLGNTCNAYMSREGQLRVCGCMHI